MTHSQDDSDMRSTMVVQSTTELSSQDEKSLERREVTSSRSSRSLNPRASGAL